LKIAVDGYELVESGTGVGRVVENLLFLLVRWMPEDQFYLFTRKPFVKYSAANMIQESFGLAQGYFRWQNGPFRNRLKRVEPDVLIASNYTLPLFGRWPAILIEHDVSFASHPEWFSPKDVFKRRHLVQGSLRKCEKVVTDSEFSKNEIIKHFDVEPGKIKVIRLGIDENFRRSPAELVLDWKSRHGLQGKKVIGFLGSIFNRRNIPLLVEAVDQVRSQQPDMVLFVVGRDLTHPPQGIARILDKDWIRWEETLSEEELPLFYSSLDVFAYLSEYEGFGLPPLEALACGTVPVLLKASSLGEIYQGLAFMVEQADVSQVAGALVEAAWNENLRKTVLDEFMRTRDRFSWETAAREYMKLLKDIVEEAGA
jgi:glycosyltransferase involved in cell wall biosynthesis